MAVALPTLAMLALNTALAGVVPPFLTYFPAVTLAALFLGPAWGTAVLVCSAGLANYLFIPPLFAWSVSSDNVLVTGLYLFAGGLIVVTAATLRTSVRELEAKSALERDLNAELQHRVKNNLAVVQALARQTVASTPEPDQFYSAFRGRLIALSEAHDVLVSGKWTGCRLPELVDAAVRPFRSEGVFAIEGPNCELPAQSCVPLVMALHELSTNAVKYGALSTPAGHVSVRWEVAGGGFRLTWREAFGPPVKKPKRVGLGSRLLTRQSGLDDVALQFLPEGVVCEIAISGAVEQT
ncbi:HWE histidine kinase domain-containing protein [Phenylobacterium sp.]|uniref:HWE histidine kinase domain-containing protein n=1 Tax=Phenylobacterium sp. TaxID=1871053 RepID=UPI0025D0D06E|nr:HWE histidine kinase domain-containing protein [Phenylobacterium sp.]